MRCSGGAFDTNVSVGLLGGFAPLLSTALIQWTGNLLAPAAYIIVSAVATLVGALCLKDRTGQQL